jgi:hypothetical protein
MFFLSGDSPASELFVSTFWNTLLYLHSLTPTMKTEQSSKMSLPKIQTPGNHPKEIIQHSEHGESLKSRINSLCYTEQISVWDG